MRQGIVIFALTSILSGCSSEGDKGSSKSGPSEYRDNDKATVREAAAVDILRQQFSPREVTIHAGESVLWRNTSSETHTVTADPSKANNQSDVALPTGAKPFSSGELRPGKTFRHTFTAAGTYRYVCTLHEGMSATVVVRPAEPQTH